MDSELRAPATLTASEQPRAAGEAPAIAPAAPVEDMEPPHSLFRQLFKQSLGELAIIDQDVNWTIRDGVRYSLEVTASMNTLVIFLRGPKRLNRLGIFHPSRKLVWNLSITGDTIGEVAVDSSWLRDANRPVICKFQDLPTKIVDQIKLLYPEIYERLIDVANDDSSESESSGSEPGTPQGSSPPSSPRKSIDPDFDPKDPEFKLSTAFLERAHDLNLKEPAAEPAAPPAAEPAAPPAAEPAAPAKFQAAAKRINQWAKLAELSNELKDLVYVRTVDEPEVFEDNLPLQIEATKYLDVILANCTEVRKRAADAMAKNYVKVSKVCSKKRKLK